MVFAQGRRTIKVYPFTGPRLPRLGFGAVHLRDRQDQEGDGP